MAEHEVEIHPVGPTADTNLERLGACRNTFVLEAKLWQPLDPYKSLSLVAVNLYEARVAGVHLNGFPASGGLEARIARCFTRPHSAMERIERPIESSESADLYTPDESSLDIREILSDLSESPTLICERDRLLVLLPGRGPLLERSIIEQALLGKHIIQADVPCPAQVGPRAISADQLWILCCRGIV